MSDQVAEEIKVQEWIRLLRGILIVAAAAAIAGLAYMAVGRMADSKSEKAFSLLFQAERLEQEAATAAESTKSDPKEAEALNLGYVFEAAKKWPADKQKDYLARLGAVVEAYPGTLPAALALLRQGNFYFHMGQFSEAQKSFEECAKSFKPSGEKLVYRAMAFDGLGASQEAQLQWDAALKTHQEASQISGNPLKPLALLGMARVQRAQGKMDLAKPLYEQVIKDFPNSEYEKRARALLSLPTEG